jgi:DNA-binding IclR family transcriptional regulator
MHARLSKALRLLSFVGSRPNPTEPIGVGELSRIAGLSLSVTSRIAAEMGQLGLLERGTLHGTYRLGPRAIALSGASASRVAKAIHFASTLVAQQTGETFCLAAESSEGAHIIAAVESGWTLYAPGIIGETVTAADSAMNQALRGLHASQARFAQAFESENTGSQELAVPVCDAHGNTIATIGVRLPKSRSSTGLTRAHRSLKTARATLEAAIAEPSIQSGSSPFCDSPEDSSILTKTTQVLEFLAVSGPCTFAEISAHCSVQRERLRRLIDTCGSTGFVSVSSDRRTVRLNWMLHGWHRALVLPLIRERADALVSASADESGLSTYLTVLQGMRSVTVAEAIRQPQEDLAMQSWLGRPHPIVGSDGGPALLMDLEPDQIRAVFPSRHTESDVDDFLVKVERIRHEGVLLITDFGDDGLVSVTAPVRNASQTVAGAVCIVGSHHDIAKRSGTVQSEALRLADSLTQLLRLA